MVRGYVFEIGNPEMGMDNRSRERERERVQSSVSRETDRSILLSVLQRRIDGPIIPGDNAINYHRLDII